MRANSYLHSGSSYPDASMPRGTAMRAARRAAETAEEAEEAAAEEEELLLGCIAHPYESYIWPCESSTACCSTHGAHFT